jgi:hypothetical protein
MESSTQMRSIWQARGKKEGMIGSSLAQHLAQQVVSPGPPLAWPLDVAPVRDGAML